MKKVLICDDESSAAALFEAILGKAGYQAKAVNSLETLKTSLRQEAWDAILLDLYMGSEESTDIIPYIIRTYPHTKIFMISAEGTVEAAARAVNLGATTFLSKGNNPQYLVRELDRSLRPGLTERQCGENINSYGIIGQHPSVLALLEQIDRIKNFDSTVLVGGESGTGKELVARAIHLSSKRKEEEFRAINCGAIPNNLLEAELFGYRRGAFTDAKSDRVGFFELCSKGTLFLDEIGEMPLDLQVKLLRVLQEKEVTPLGATKSVKIKTRIIVATNRDLCGQVQSRKFREDLYYRISVISIVLPPLRERPSDIPLLTRVFLEIFNEKFGKNILPPTPELDAKLMAYDWPGNIRELQNAVERGGVMTRDQFLHFEDMIPRLAASQGCTDATIEREQPILQLSEAKREFEREYLMRLLSSTRGNIAEASRVSGRYRADLYRLMDRHKIDLEEFRGH